MNKNIFDKQEERLMPALRRRRQELGMTQEELARMMGKFEVGSIQKAYGGEEPYIRVVPRNNTASWSWTAEQRTYFSRKHKTLDEAVQTIREYLGKRQVNEGKADEDAPKKKKAALLHVCSIIRKDERGVSYGICHKLPGNVKLMLKRGFAKPEEAFEYLRERRAELEERTAAMKRKPNVEAEVTSERDGKDYRGGRNVDNAEFMETFVILGITYGNRVNRATRQAKLNATYDALLELSPEIERTWEKPLENVLADMPEEKSDDYYAESVPVCPMPPLFALFGFPNEPIMGSPFTFHHAIFSKHLVSETEMKKLPRCL